MIKAIPVMAVLAIVVATPALAQQTYPRYPADESATTAPPSSRDDAEEQARTPESDERSSGEIETLRQRGMSSPNVVGEAVPENPSTGVPAPEAAGDSKQLESVPRP